MKFESVVPNVDLDILAAPEGLWSRVAVVGLWRDKSAIRRKWPKASVVGPLRTLRGFDLFARNLLHNPQIRAVIFDGTDVGGQGVLDQLRRLFSAYGANDTIPADASGWRPMLNLLLDGPKGTPEIERLKPGDPAFETLCFIFGGDRFDANDGDPGVRLIDARDIDAFVGQERRLYEQAPEGEGELLDDADYEDLAIGQRVRDADRPGGKFLLPPPPPESGDAAPAGDAGQRVAGSTLVDVWPQVLREVMLAGREAKTQYGMTKELLSLTSVIRDPALSVKQLDDATVLAQLNLKAEALIPYYRQITGEDPPPRSNAPGEVYSYGSRLRDWRGVDARYQAVCCERIFDMPLPVICPVCQADHSRTAKLVHNWKQNPEPADQYQAIEKLLHEKPDTRAAFLTPWIPAIDTGKESGRPCLVGLWFRRVLEPSTEAPRLLADGDIVLMSKDDPGFLDNVKKVARGESMMTVPAAVEMLHLDVTFRSHDLFAGYAENLAALCRLLVDTAARQGMAVGSVTCHSLSAHVYDRDWSSARDAIAAYEARTRGQLDLDQRSSWHVENVFDACVACDGTGDHKDHTGNDCGQCDGHGRINKRIRATALTPDGGRVLRVIEGTNVQGLRGQIERSGLVTSIGSALWLGAELALASRKL